MDEVMIQMQMTKIRSLVRRQIITALEEDLIGGELLMKEVWEECVTDDHELEEILEWLRDRDRRLRD